MKSIDAVKAHIRQQFMDRVGGKQGVIVHFMTATDSDNVKSVLESVKLNLLDRQRR